MALGNATMQHLVENVLRSPGEALPSEVRRDMESRFCADFGEVRVHAGSEASDSAMAVEAKAYTVGEDIVFGEGGYAPDTSAGRELLAHELAHVVQQRRGGAAPSPHGDAQLEAGADEAAAAMLAGSGPLQVSGASGVGLARQPAPFFDPAKRYPHTVTFKTWDDYVNSDASSIMSQNPDGSVTAIVWRSYPESALAAPKPAPPAPKPVAKPPKPKPKPKQEEPVDVHLLMDIVEATAPRLIYPKPVRQFFGGLQLVGGGLEAIGGGVGGILTAETGVGLVGGALVLGHGLDVASSGAYTLWTGEESKTYTYMAGAGWAYTFGADPKLANAVGQSTELVANIGSAGLSLKAAATPFTIAEEQPYRLLFYHGRVAGRDIITVDTPSGVRAFYARTGGGGSNIGGAQPGDWAPFEGFSSQGGVFPYRGSLYQASEGWFVKHRFAFGLKETDPLYRFGTPENLEISEWLRTQRIPTGGPAVPWQQVQPELQFFGVRTIDPIPYYGPVRVSF
jgi:hypothetical protein